MWIQILLIAALLLIAFFATRSVARDSHLALRRLVLIVALIAGVVIVIVPQWLSAIAHFLGIGRGTDLLLYGLIVAFLGWVLADYRHRSRERRRMTALVRAQALAEARRDDPAGGALPSRKPADPTA
jgi:small membrane protein